MTLLPAQRRQEILRAVRGGTAHVSDLAESFGVSEMTVRRDLGALARDGKLERVHGGAVDGNGEPGFSQIEVERSEIKEFVKLAKTIQRWRRRGLSARRFVFPDGKRRVGFRLSVVFALIGLQLPGVLPSALLGRRPDIVAARWRVEAAGKQSRVLEAIHERSGRIGYILVAVE